MTYSKRVFSKLISLLLVTVMVVGFLPGNLLGGLGGNSLNANAALLTPAETIPWLRLSANGKTIEGFNYSPGVSPTEITIPAVIDGITITAIGTDAFAGSGITRVEFEAGCQITSIGTRAFQGTPIASITLPEGLLTLGLQAFSNCKELETVNFVNTITNLGYSPFSGCAKLTSVDLSALTSVTEIQPHTFSGCPLTTALLPEGLETIGDNAFYGNKFVGTVKIPSTVKTINGALTFTGVTVGVVIDMTDHHPGTIAGVHWSAPDAIIRWHPDAYDNLSDFIFNKTTGQIAGLKETYSGDGNIVIPTHIDGIAVTGLTDGAFGSRPSRLLVKTVTFAPGSTITEIPRYAFSYCGSLTSIVFPDQITSIGDYSFRGCSYLTSVTFPVNLKTLGSWAFRGCTGLSSITLPEGLENIGDSFVDCNFLTAVSIPASVQTMMNSFGSCIRLKTVTIVGDNITSINASSFASASVTDIYLPMYDEGDVANAPWGAGNASIHWRDVTIPAEIVTDDTGLWKFNTRTNTIVSYLGTVGNTVDLVVPASLDFAGVNYPTPILDTGRIASTGSEFKSVTISDGIINIGRNVFQNIKVGTLDLGNTLEVADANSFDGSGLTSLTLPESIKTLGGNAFQNNSLTGEIVLPGNLTDVPPNVFINNPGITQFTVKLYRLKASDGVYDPSQDKYLKASTSLVNNAPFGATHLADSVYYMDSPRFEPSHTLQLNAASNTVTIKFKNKMSDLTAISGIAADTGSPAVSNVYIPINGRFDSTAEMVITAADGNGNYKFATTNMLSGQVGMYTVTIDVFHNIAYEGNYNTSGTAPVNTNNYMETYALTLPTKAEISLDRKSTRLNSSH